MCSGYMAPEYRIHKQFSVKSDVYSFGILLLEIVSGQGIHSFRSGENLEHLPSYVSKIIHGYISLVFSSLSAHARGIFSLVFIQIMSCRHGEAGARELLQIL